ncbi:MAG TPA: MBOAT family protein [Myxococcota bacterium]|jgi:alginate O-acetyltransferase complex protein AlgI
MVFSSVIFLFCFLPLVLAAYWIAPRRARNTLLLVASLIFYAWGEVFYVGVMLASIAMNYLFGRWVDGARGGRGERQALAIAVAANLGLLGWFKYANFLVENANRLLSGQPGSPLELAPVHLPLGISFFTFHALSYLIDVRRGVSPAMRNPVDMALYIALFPQLIAGPIIRFHDIAAEIVSRQPRIADVASGIRRFVIGLGKKVLIANVVGRVADSIFEIPTGELTPGLAWLGALSYALQIYFDFSGYSDMAIGLGRIFGFHFLENFNFPYVSRSVTEFWRRWHISLSNWFRDYLYVPLGGNRGGAARTYRNLLTVFLLCGLWHGASWSFVLWGLYHGSFLVLERGFRGRNFRVWSPLAHAATLLAVLIGWVIFRAETLPQAGAFLAAMAGQASGTGREWYLAMYLDPVFGMAFAAGAVGSIPWLPALVRAWQAAALRAQGGRRAAIEALGQLAAFAALAAIGLVSAMQLSIATHNPFIYFRF